MNAALSWKSSFPLLFVFAFGSIAWTACTKDEHTGSGLPEHRYYNEHYGTDNRQTLDVYLPARRDNQSTPFLILIHGGAWVSGDKGDFNAIQDSLMQRGIASVSINYRFVNAALHYEELMQDVDAAVNYCFSKKEEWNIRSDKYLIGGISAGAHMSLLYSYRYNTSGRIAAVISAAGPTDVTRTDWLDYTVQLGLLDDIEAMVGASYTPGQPLDARFTAASPRYQISNIPTLMLHGTADAVVPYDQSGMLAADLVTQGVTHKLVSFPGANHDLGLANPVYYQLLLTEMENWCKTYGR